MLIPALADGTAVLADVLKNALMVFPAAGALRGALMWRLNNGYHAFKCGTEKGA